MVVGPADLWCFPHLGRAAACCGCSRGQSRAEAFLSLGVFISINLFPVPGWYLVYGGIAGGFAITLTVIGFAIAPAVGVLVAGFCAGIILSLFAGPTLTFIKWAQWKTLLWGYDLGGALGAGALVLGQVMFDPALANTFGANMPWLTALGTLGTVLLLGSSPLFSPAAAGQRQASSLPPSRRCGQSSHGLLRWLQSDHAGPSHGDLRGDHLGSMTSS
jgi:hypothetical protein